jgi:hypothetical protein
MAEELGKIEVVVLDQGGSASGSGGPASASVPNIAPPTQPTNPQQHAMGVWQQIKPYIGQALPGGLGQGVSAIGSVTAAVGSVAVTAAAIGGMVVVIGLAVKAVKAAILAVWGWHDAMLSVAQRIGNIDPRIASANASERVAEINRRFSMSGAQGDYAALAIRQQTDLANALTDLSNTINPLLSLVSGTLVGLVTDLIRGLNYLASGIGEFASSIGITLRGAVEAALSGIANVIKAIFPGAVQLGEMLTGSTMTQEIERVMKNMDKMLASINRNTRPGNVVGANAWAVNEIRALGGHGW